ALDPDYVEAMNNLAVLCRDLGKRGEAEALFLRALSQGPDNAEAHLNYALFLEGTGRQGEARSHYQSYLRLAPPGDPMSIRTKELLR
ncbi:MAG: tetratricopeptide repeat protein, partial [Nitrospirae bacterium]|nr:tetratricopeptide repeat protein [Nitrospirota bacterium]